MQQRIKFDFIKNSQAILFRDEKPRIPIDFNVDFILIELKCNFKMSFHTENSLYLLEKSIRQPL